MQAPEAGLLPWAGSSTGGSVIYFPLSHCQNNFASNENDSSTLHVFVEHLLFIQSIFFRLNFSQESNKVRLVIIPIL